MKKVLILSALAMGVFFSSCGSMGGGNASLKTSKDSALYAIGIDLGSMAFNFDSTMNVDLIVAGVRDVFANNKKLTPEQAQAQIQIYVQERQQEMQAEAAIKFTKDSTDNLAASTKYIEDKIKDGYTKLESGILYKIATQGKGANIEVGDSMKVHYTLTLPNGEKVDSSLDRGEPTDFFNQEPYLIPGFIEAMTYFNKGTKATFVLPHELGYGAMGNGRGVGPCMALTFEVEVIDIMKQPKK